MARAPAGSRLLREGLERAGGLWLDVRTRTEGYYERLGASRSLGFRLTREDLGRGGTADNPMVAASLRLTARVATLALCA